MTEGLSPAAGDRELTADEIEAFDRDSLFDEPGALNAEEYPRARNVSAAFIYQRVVRASAEPEYVTVPLADRGSRDASLFGAIAEWNLLWEAAQFRRRFFAADQIPAELREIADRGDVNVMFVPRTTSRYYEYAPLFHLLSQAQVLRHGLPLLRTAIWPFLAQTEDVDRYLPADFGARLSRAWASAVWRHLIPGSPLRGFSASDPIRLLGP
ncbi:MAG: hypothetical protein ACRDOK_16255 [Streptosporangiaceae bacterium]